MVKALTIEMEHVGPVLFEQSRRARRLNISVKPFKGVRVAVPCGITMKRAETIARAKLPWISRQLLRMRKIEKEIEYESSIAPSIDKETATKQLTTRLKELAAMHGLLYNKVAVRNQKTLWGSCSAKNNISLNMRLVTLDSDLIDYVILHELAHLKIKNHSELFWKELQRLMPEAKEMSMKLKQHRIM